MQRQVVSDYFGESRKLSVSACRPLGSRNVRGTLAARAGPESPMFPSSVQEEEAHLRAALRASAAQASPSSARGSGVSERGARHRQRPRSVLDPAHLAAEHHERAMRERESVLAATASLKAAARARPTHRARDARVPAATANAAFHDTANDVGTAFYPTQATVPVNRRGGGSAAARFSNSRASNRHDGYDAAQLHEALRRSKEEADLAEALRLSALESRESHGSRGGSRVSKTTDETETETVSDSLQRERTTRDAFGIRAIRRGYGVSPEIPHHEPLVSSSRAQEDDARDVAAAAFRAAVFGETRVSSGRRRGVSSSSAREEEEEENAASRQTPERSARGRDEPLSQNAEDDEMARIAAALARPAAESRARAALEREALERAWAEAAAAAERKRARERFSAAAADAAAREKRRAARREADLLERDAARRERKRAAEAEAETARLETARKAAESEAASALVARTIGRLDLPGALAAVGFAPSDASSAAAVRKAYKRAALRFHPDRTRALSVAERARGEEVWKALGSKMEAFERTAR